MRVQMQSESDGKLRKGDIVSGKSAELAYILENWRTSAINTLLAMAALTISPALIVVVFRAFRDPESLPTALAYLGSYLCLVALTVFRKIDFRLRTWGLILLAYLTGLLAMALGGLVGDGRVWFITVPVLALILISVRAGIFMAVLNMLSYLFFAVAAQLGWLSEWMIVKGNSLALLDWVLGGFVLGASLIMVIILQSSFSKLLELIAVEKGQLYERAQEEIIVRKRTEELLQKNRDVLEKQVEDRTAEFVKINGKLHLEIEERVQMETALLESEEKFRELVESSSDWIWEVNMQGVYIYSSPQVENILGYTSDEVVGKMPFDFMPTGEAERIAELFKAFSVEESPINALENVNVHKDGRELVLETKAVPIFDETGKAVGYRGIDRDITGRKHYENEREALVSDLAHRSLLLQTAASISKSVIAILSPDELLQKTVEHIQERFNYYYVGIFLLDKKKEFAVLKAGTGKAGKEMLKAEHALAVGGKSMVGWSVAQAKARIALDVGEEAVRFDNPLLPETRSEMALPLVDRTEAIGALTVQSIEESAFTNEDIAALQTMVDQLAISIQNSQLYEQAQHEITERKQIGNALRKSEERFRSIFENAVMGLYRSTPDGRILMANPALLGMLGYSSFEKIDQRNLDENGFEPKKQRAIFKKRMKEEGQVIGLESVWERKDGNLLFVRENAKSIYDEEGNILHYEGTVEDITERRLSDDALRESEERFRAIFETAQDSVFIKDRSLRYTQINSSMQKLFGLPVEEMVGLRNEDLFSDETGRKTRDVDLRVLNGEIVDEEKSRLVQGITQTFHIIKVPMRDETGQIIGLCGISRDITARKKAEDELRKAQNYITNIINSMPSALIGVDAEGIVTQWNSAAQRVSGLLPGEALGQPLEDAIPRLSTELKQVRVALQSREVQIHPKKAYVEKGETHYEDVTVYPLVANGVEGAVIRVDDVTEQVRLEEMMLQSEKMLSVGGLAAGIAHEINNPLAGMLQTADNMANRLTNMKLSANLRAAEKAGINMEALQSFMKIRGIPRMLDTINESGHRVADIVDNMLSFARKSDSVFSTHNIVDLLDKTVGLASTEYDLKKSYDFRTIKIIKDYEDNLPSIPCEGSKIQQVFLNILRNGAQAMQQADTPNPTFALCVRHEKRTQMLSIEIKNNGPSIDKSIRKRVFEPFFTTKPVGEGTGLGLSVSYFIITENHGGTLSVTSEPKQGASFIIRLPLKRIGRE